MDPLIRCDRTSISEPSILRHHERNRQDFWSHSMWNCCNGLGRWALMRLCLPVLYGLSQRSVVDQVPSRILVVSTNTELDHNHKNGLLLSHNILQYSGQSWICQLGMVDVYRALCNLCLLRPDLLRETRVFTEQEFRFPHFYSVASIRSACLWLR